MIRFDSITKTDAYVELTTSDGQKTIMPTSTVIFIDDESGLTTIKNTASRAIVGVIPTSAIQ